ncbi:MAG: HAMP domain-containing sensor histidine kinase [Candidatus Binatia bacterium]
MPSSTETRATRGDVEGALVEKIEELSLLRVLAERLADARDYGAACQALTDLVWEERAVDAVAFLSVDREHGLARLEATSPAQGAVVGAPALALDEPPFPALLEHAEPTLLLDALPPSWCPAHGPAERGVLIGAPLRVRGTVTGVLLVYTTGAAPNVEEDRRLLAIVAPAAAPALDTARTSAREEFLALLRHDISTPLTVATGYAEMLAQELESREDGTLAPMAAAILGSVQAVADLVSNYLHLAAIDRGVPWLVLEQVDLTALVTSIAARYRLAAHDKHLELVCTGRCTPISGDARQLGRVVTNLLSNAVKYSGRSGTIAVTLADDGGDAVLAVTDPGDGIAPEDLPRLFTRGARLHRDRSIPGTGLGLFLTRAIVEAHGGIIQAQSTVGVGSTFTVRLPRTPA